MQWAGAGAPTTPSATVIGSAQHGDYVSVKTTAMSRFLINAQSTNHKTRWDRVAAVPLLNARVIEPAVFGASAKAQTTADLSLLIIITKSYSSFAYTLFSLDFINSDMLCFLHLNILFLHFIAESFF